MNGSERLKEILGFDPVGGECIEDVSRLESVGGTYLPVPPMVQSAFIEDCERHYSEVVVVRVVPEKLLHIAKSHYSNCVTRVYHLWEPPPERKQEFPGAALVAFEKRDARFDVREVSMFGEEKRPEGVEWRTIIFNRNGVSCRFDSQDKHFLLHFDKNGLIDRIQFCLRKRKDTIGIQDYVEIQGETMKELLARSSLRMTGGQSNYELVVEDGIIRVRRLETEGMQDEILFRRKVSSEVIVGQLIDPQTLDDPVNAPPELDDSWHFGNLMKTAGVKWEI